MYVFVVLVTGFGGHIEPWGVYSSAKAAMTAQDECRRYFPHERSGSIWGMETCEIWRYHLDADDQYYWPRSQIEPVDQHLGMR